MIAQLDRTYVQYGKGYALRRVLTYLLFEGRAHTTRGQWVNPFVRAFLELLAAIPGDIRADRPIYITGLGRSGTTILGKLLSLHEDVGFLNEPKLMWSIADKSTDICGDYYRSGGRIVLEATDCRPDTARIVNRILARYARMMGVKRALDKYPEFIFRIGYLREALPDARIIFIVRNGIDAVASVAQWSRSKGIQTRTGNEDWWGRDDIKWTYFCEQIIKQLPEYSDVAKMDLPGLDHVNRAAIEWIATMRKGLQELQDRPGLIYRVNYEELVEQPTEQLKRLMQACDLPFSDNVLEYAKDVLNAPRAKEKPVLVPAVAALFDDTMNQLGY